MLTREETEADSIGLIIEWVLTQLHYSLDVEATFQYAAMAAGLTKEELRQRISHTQSPSNPN